MIVTPYFKVQELNKLKGDTLAVYQLCAYNDADLKIHIVYYYQYLKPEAYFKFFTVLFSMKTKVFQDSFGNNVLFFQNPGIVPKQYKTMGIFNLKFRRQIKDYLHRNKIELDAIAVHFPSLFNSFIRRVPCKRKVAILHAFDVDKPRKLKELGKYLSGYQAIGFRSHHIKKTFLQQIKWGGEQALCLSGIPESLLAENLSRKPWKPDEKLRIAFAGHLNPNKNLKTLLLALGQVKESIDFELTVMGDGPLEAELKAQARQLGIGKQVLFTGRIPRVDTIRQMRTADVFVLVSHKETLGLVYLEALAAGCVVVGSVGRGIDGLIRHGENGYLVQPESAQELADTLLVINGLSEEQLEQLRQKAWKIIKDQSESNASRHYLNFILGKG